MSAFVEKKIYLERPDSPPYNERGEPAFIYVEHLQNTHDSGCYLWLFDESIRSAVFDKLGRNPKLGLVIGLVNSFHEIDCHRPSEDTTLNYGSFRLYIGPGAIHIYSADSGFSLYQLMNELSDLNKRRNFIAMC